MKILQFTIPVSQDRSFTLQKDRLPHFYPHLHRHEEIQITWVQKGEGTLIADNHMHTFRSGAIFWIGSNQPHVFKSDPAYFAAGSKKIIHAYSIFFNPEGVLKGLFSLQEFRKIKSFLRQAAAGFCFSDDVAGEVSDRIQAIYNSKSMEQFLHFAGLLHYIQGISNIQPLAAGSRSLQVNDQEGIRIGSIYDYIMKHYDADISLDAIAKHASMTPQAFCRYFKKHTRLTFVSFLNEVRINDACKRLAEGSFESISAIAYQCGFSSIANFNRVFKIVTGKSPREYLSAYHTP